jgi:hypothetical protein
MDLAASLSFSSLYSIMHLTYVPELYLPSREGTRGTAASRSWHCPLSKFITDVFNSKRAEVLWLALFPRRGKKIGGMKVVQCTP